MKELNGRVAVVTGAASGIGLAMAHRFAREGMKIVLADIEADALGRAEAAIRGIGAQTVAVRVDVSSEADVIRLADTAFDAFDNVHLLCNNAGVAPIAVPRSAWEAPLSDWTWVMGVNFLGVLHGVRAFVPRMLARSDEGQVVNTASLFGLVSASNPYHVSKHAVVCLTEGIYKDFRAMGAKLSASVLCPGWIRTQILDGQRNRPAHLGAPTDPSSLLSEARLTDKMMRNFVSNGFEPDEVAEQVVGAVRDDSFYVLPGQPWFIDLVRTRMQDISLLRNPTLPPPMQPIGAE